MTIVQNMPRLLLVNLADTNRKLAYYVYTESLMRSNTSRLKISASALSFATHHFAISHESTTAISFLLLVYSVLLKCLVFYLFRKVNEYSNFLGYFRGRNTYLRFLYFYHAQKSCHFLLRA